MWAVSYDVSPESDNKERGQTAGSGLVGGKERQCVVRVRDFTSLAVVLSPMVVDNDYQRNCDDHKTTRDSLARHENVKKKKKKKKNEGCGLQRNLNGITTNCFAVTKFSTC